MNKSTKHNNKNISINDAQYGDYFEINSVDTLNHICTVYDLDGNEIKTIYKTNLTTEELYTYLYSNNVVNRKLKILP